MQKTKIRKHSVSLINHANFLTKRQKFNLLLHSFLRFFFLETIKLSIMGTKLLSVQPCKLALGKGVGRSVF